MSSGIQIDDQQILAGTNSDIGVGMFLPPGRNNIGIARGIFDASGTATGDGVFPNL